MKITGHRTILTQHDRRRKTGDANGVFRSNLMVVPVLVLTTDEGMEGIGIGAHQDIDRVFGAIDGEDPRSVTVLYDRMLASVFKTGHAGATFGTIGAVDMALWDLKAKMAGEPLWRLLGGRDKFIPAYASGIDAPLSDEQLAALYEEFADHGFVAAKLKGGNDLPGALRRLGIVKDILSRNTTNPALMLDVNEAWNPSQAVRFLSVIESRFDLTWVEEPVRRWDAAGLALVRQKINAAVASGENLTGLEQFIPLILAHSVDVVQASGGWGVTHMLRVASLAHAHDLPISPVGYNFTSAPHVAAAIPNHMVTELQDLCFPDGIKVDLEFEDGGIVLGESAGSGVSVNELEITSAPSGADDYDETSPYVRPAQAGLHLGSWKIDGIPF